LAGEVKILDGIVLIESGAETLKVPRVLAENIHFLCLKQALAGVVGA